MASPLRYRRVLLKLSGEALTGDKTKEGGISASRAAFIAGEIQRAHAEGLELGIVIGGGNIYRGGEARLEAVPRSTGDAIGMLATVINSLVLQCYLEQAGVPTSLYGAFAVERIVRPFFAADVTADLHEGRVVILAGGTGNPFFTTDTTAALRCAQIGGQALLKATKVDGVYDSDPIKVPEAKKIPSLTYTEAIQRGLRIMDLTAFSFCMEYNIPTIVFKFIEPGNLVRCVRGEQVGSVITTKE